NLISGNDLHGVFVEIGPNVLIQNNYIGTDSTGATAVGNGLGVLIGSASGNTVRGNVISGNVGGGVGLGGNYGPFLTTGNVVAGNRIGTDADGTSSVGNQGPGIAITSYVIP